LRSFVDFGVRILGIEREVAELGTCLLLPYSTNATITIAQTTGTKIQLLRMLQFSYPYTSIFFLSKNGIYL